MRHFFAEIHHLYHRKTEAPRVLFIPGKGLITAKKAVILSSSGGIYENGMSDSGVPYLKAIPDFIGMQDVDVIAVDSVAQSPDVVAENRVPPVMPSRSLPGIAGKHRENLPVSRPAGYHV